MKAIRLTEEQETHLLEMANSLFPNRDWKLWAANEDLDSNIMLRNPYYVSINNHATYPATKEIHWLEFMIYHLIPKLAKTYGFNIHIDIPNEDRSLIDVVYDDFYTETLPKKPKLKRTK